jgi:hypothetical protein
MPKRCPLTKEQKDKWCREWNCEHWKYCRARPISISIEEATERVSMKLQLAFDKIVKEVVTDNLRKEMSKWIGKH